MEEEGRERASLIHLFYFMSKKKKNTIFKIKKKAEFYNVPVFGRERRGGKATKNRRAGSNHPPHQPLSQRDSIN